MTPKRDARLDALSATQRAQLQVLGEALQGRAEDVLAACQARFLAYHQARGQPLDPAQVCAAAGWELTVLATKLIARWLCTGEPASPEERAQVAGAGTELVNQRTRPPRPRQSSTARVSLGMVLRLNHWWAEELCRLLAYEADRHRLDPGVLTVACKAVRDSGRWSTLITLEQVDHELEALEARLWHLAQHDPLTGAANRAALLDQLTRALPRHRRRQTGIAVLYVDLDGFKALNDTHGHHAGDQILIATARALHHALRPEDLVARVGGDEFVALCEDLPDPPRDAAFLATRVSEDLHTLETPGGRHLQASTGAVSVCSIQPSVDEILRVADHAMYQAKHHRQPWVLIDLDNPSDSVHALSPPSPVIIPEPPLR